MKSSDSVVYWRGSRHVDYNRDMLTLRDANLYNYFCTDYNCIYNTTKDEPILHVRDEAVLLSTYLCEGPEPEIVVTSTGPDPVKFDTSAMGSSFINTAYSHPALFNTLVALNSTPKHYTACFLNASYTFLPKRDLLTHRYYIPIFGLN